MNDIEKLYQETRKQIEQVKQLRLDNMKLKDQIREKPESNTERGKNPLK